MKHTIQITTYEKVDFASLEDAIAVSNGAMSLDEAKRRYAESVKTKSEAAPVAVVTDISNVIAIEVEQ